MKNIQGFTLVELLVALVVATILLTVGIPSMRDFVLNGRIVSQANEFVTGIQLARATAIKQQRNASICVSTTWNNAPPNPPTCTGGTDWSAGWVVWVDQDQDGVLDLAEVLRVNDPFDASSTFTSAARTSFTYGPTGLVDNQDALTLCDNRSGETGRSITITPAGRVNLAQVPCA